jgi:hypothetical protein
MAEIMVRYGLFSMLSRCCQLAVKSPMMPANDTPPRSTVGTRVQGDTDNLRAVEVVLGRA